MAKCRIIILKKGPAADRIKSQQRDREQIYFANEPHDLFAGLCPHVSRYFRLPRRLPLCGVRGASSRASASRGHRGSNDCHSSLLYYYREEPDSAALTRTSLNFQQTVLAGVTPIHGSPSPRYLIERHVHLFFDDNSTVPAIYICSCCGPSRNRQHVVYIGDPVPLQSAAFAFKGGHHASEKGTM